MKRRVILLTAAVIIGSVLSGSLVFGAPAENFSAGTAKVKITPSSPTPMAGYGSRTENFEGVHDDLYARVVVFSDGVNKAAIITADIIGFPEEQWEAIVKGINEKTGIKKEYILLCATHTHSGPNNRVDEESSENVKNYVKELRVNIVNAVVEADKNLEPAAIGAGKGECLMNINRRAVNKRGEIVLGRNPYGVCDHQVGVIRIDYENRSPMAVMVNWPSNATTMGTHNYLISGDWPGATARYVENKLNDIIVPVTAGSCGNINPIYGPVADFKMAYAYAVDAIGKNLGEEVIRVSKNTKTVSRAKISAIQRIISLPGKERNTYEEFEKEGMNAFKPAQDFKMRLSAIKIGDVVLTGIAQEFNEIGIKIKEASPYKYTFVVDHCNASSEYVPTDEAFKLGGYEVMKTRLMPGAEKIIIKNILDMINEL